jgi:tetratricopeptide (TPR) repeat protein
MTTPHDAATLVMSGTSEPEARFVGGDVIANRYRILRPLGRGGMGEVFEAEDLELHERVALKTILPSLANDERLVAAFKREIALARRVTHPNVCRTFDLDFHGATLFVTMELLEGETLAELLQRKGRLTPEEALPIAKQLAAGLDAAHAAGIVHRDFKPGNVMIAGNRAVITDFGLARAAAAEDAHGDSHVIGTPAYMAPEQVERGETKAPADIYAFGIVLYEMVAGALPFEGDSGLSALVKRLEKAPTPPRAHVPDLDVRWEHAILRCLARDPAKRYKTASEAIDVITATSKPRRTGLALAALLVALAILAPLAWIATREAPRASKRRAVAVLGFRNLSGAPDSAWLSTALAEMLATELAAGGRLRVIPGEQVARAKTDLSIREVDAHAAPTLARIRRNLSTDYVILGSYVALAHGAARPLRLDVRIQDANEGETVGAFTLSGDQRELLDLVSGAGTELRRRLGVVAPIDTSATRRALPSGDAARLYAQGLERLRLFDAAAAVTLLQQAVEIDPTSTRAHSALAAAWMARGHDEEARKAAKDAFDRATGLPREEVLFAEARYREAAKEWDRAIEAYRALFDFYPDSVEYGLALASVQSSARKGEDALQTVERVRRIAGDDLRIDLAEAEAARWISDFKRMENAGVRARDNAMRNGAVLLEARARLHISMAARNTNRPEVSIEEALRARALFDAKGDRWGVAHSMNMVGSARFDQGRLRDALAAFQEAFDLSRGIGDRFGTLRGLNNTALIQVHMGELEKAEPLYRQTVEMARGIDDKISLTRALNNLAEVPYLRGQYDEAQKLDEEALALARITGDRWLIANILFDLGDVALARGDLVTARKHHEEALALRRALGDSGIANESLLSIAEIALASNDAKRAERIAREVLAAVKGKRRDNERIAMVLLARALLTQNRRADAEPIVREAVAAGRASENPRVRLSVLALEARFNGDEARLRSIRDEANARGLRAITSQF